MKNSLFFFLMLLSISVSAQVKQLNNTGFYGNQKGEVCNDAAAFMDDEQVIKLVTDMCGRLGYKNRYIITSCSSIDNCQAKMFQQKPYILYNKSFLEGVKTLNFTNATLPGGQVNWKTLTVLAHEIGHHINYHLVNPDPNMTVVDMEIEADEFSGRLMYMMGATLPQAQSVMYDPIVSERDSYTHPGRNKRLSAIERGFSEAGRMFPKPSNNPVELPKVTEDDAQVQQELKQAEEYYDKDNYGEAFPILYKYRDHRLFTSDFQTLIGSMYYGGKGVAVDYSEAVKWYRKAAEAGNYSSQITLGDMYLFENGVMQNYSEAGKWYRMAAEQGHPRAQDMLALLYLNGLGTTRNYFEALKWYQKAAEQNRASAQCALGGMYQDGKGITQDFSEAVKWYRKAADQGDKLAMYKLGYMYENGKGTTKDLNQAKTMYKKAARLGDKEAQKACTRLGIK